MAAMASSLCELIGRLSLSDDKMSVLTQIKAILSSTSNEELWSIVSALQLNALYESIDATDRSKGLLLTNCSCAKFILHLRQCTLSSHLCSASSVSVGWSVVIETVEDSQNPDWYYIEIRLIICSEHLSAQNFGTGFLLSHWYLKADYIQTKRFLCIS